MENPGELNFELSLQFFLETKDVYCPKCRKTDMDTCGCENGGIRYLYQCYVCRDCGFEFAIRYERPKFVSMDEIDQIYKG